MMKVIYFSRKGENFVDGKIEQLDKGNTELLAEKINTKINGELIEIIPINDYPNNYNETVKLTENEKNEGCLPAYKTNPIDFSKDEIILIGFPNWHGTMPNIVKHFLSQNDLKGIRIYPFCTHEGSGFGISLNELKQLCPDSKIEIGLPVRGSRVNKSDKAIINWLNQII